MPTRPTILVFAASNSTTSINKRFALHAAHVFQDEMAAPVEIDVLDLHDFDMPVYSPEREADGIPLQAYDFCARITSADGLIISFAEYNGSYTAAFKNIFDWASRIDMKVFQDKPMVILSTSPGKNGGANVLKTAVDAAPFFGGIVKGSLSVGPFEDRFDPTTGRLTAPDDALNLRTALVALQGAVSRVPAP